MLIVLLYGGYIFYTLNQIYLYQLIFTIPLFISYCLSKLAIIIACVFISRQQQINWYNILAAMTLISLFILMIGMNSRIAILPKFNDKCGQFILNGLARSQWERFRSNDNQNSLKNCLLWRHWIKSNLFVQTMTENQFACINHTVSIVLFYMEMLSKFAIVISCIFLSRQYRLNWFSAASLMAIMGIFFLMVGMNLRIAILPKYDDKCGQFILYGLARSQWKRFRSIDYKSIKKCLLWRHWIKSNLFVQTMTENQFDVQRLDYVLIQTIIMFILLEYMCLINMAIACIYFACYLYLIVYVRHIIFILCQLFVSINFLVFLIEYLIIRFRQLCQLSKELEIRNRIFFWKQFHYKYIKLYHETYQLNGTVQTVLFIIGIISKSAAIIALIFYSRQEKIGIHNTLAIINLAFISIYSNILFIRVSRMPTLNQQCTKSLTKWLIISLK
uniref:Uncharacterized protein LOC113799113 n=1 Tax=Dermatophagoides pteronyssinus TaxID=6956 RepID=A0A6P6YJR5_DERPT|nr:uncharacterized protein LOC113799113 [Dermatophagoides pteronyssinus]